LKGKAMVEELRLSIQMRDNLGPLLSFYLCAMPQG